MPDFYWRPGSLPHLGAAHNGMRVPNTRLRRHTSITHGLQEPAPHVLHCPGVIGEIHNAPIKLRGINVPDVLGTTGFLGLGNMGSAMLRGLLDAAVLEPDYAVVHDVDSAKTASAPQGVRVAESAPELAQASDTIVVGVKPQDMDAALTEIAGSLKDRARVISIAAGISIAYIQQRAGADVRVVRVMPNTPALVRAGAAAFALGANCDERDRTAAVLVFNALGCVEEVPEAALDAVTALSGSGPAYFFRFVECMVGAAVGLGMNEAQATRLAAHTCFGAGKLLVESGEAPAALRAKVTSKGGTTAAALERFDGGGLCELVAGAMQAAAARSAELGK